MSDLVNVSYGIYLKGTLISSALCGDMSYEEGEALQAMLERDYPGCRVDIGEF